MANFHPGQYGNVAAPINHASFNNYSPYGGVSAAPEPQKRAGDQRILNFVPMIIALFVPWSVFCTVSALIAFSWHYKKTALCYGGVGLILSAILVLGLFAFDGKKKTRGNATWIVFIFMTSLLHWVASVVAGEANYHTNMLPVYDFLALDTYLSIDPEMSRGQQLMDAGRIIFSENTRLDVTRAMGFKSVNVYCVSPITSIAAGNSSKLATYDFWAVGKNCCLGQEDTAVEAGKTVGYHCGDFSNPKAHGGLRLMTDDERPFYRLAVQQAEAAFDIKAEHPLFYTWSADPIAELDDLSSSGERFFLISACVAFIVQLFLAMSAALSFSKLSRT